MVPRIYTIDCLEMYKTSDEVINFNEGTEKLASAIDGRGKMLSIGKNPERYIQGRCAITITICDSNEITQSRI